MEKIIKIKGMNCTHCINKITDALKNLKNIDDVKISLLKKEAKITGNNLDENEIKDTIKNLGYEIAPTK